MRVTIDGHPCSIEGGGPELIVRVPSVRHLRRLPRPSRVLGALRGIAERADVRVRVHAGRVLRIDVGAREWRLRRVLGVPVAGVRGRL